MTEVIEHMEESIEVLREVGGKLKPSGWLFVTTPNSETLRARLTRDHWEERLKFGHLCLFTRVALSQALQAVGFDVIHCKHPMEYSNNPVRRVAQFTLQVLGLGGNLRAVGIKSS